MVVQSNSILILPEQGLFKECCAVLREALLPSVSFMGAFSYILQVVFKNDFLGLVPYFLLMILAVCSFSFLRTNFFSSLNGVDVSLGLLSFAIAAHVIVGLIFRNYSLFDGRHALLYVGGLGIYLYISRIARDSEIRASLWAIGLVAILISTHWIFEIYTQKLFGKLSYYAGLKNEYLLMRALKDGNNPALYSLSSVFVDPLERANGLMSVYRQTAAVVAMGAFSVVALLYGVGARWSQIALSVFLIVLTIGGSQMAFLSYVFLIPIIIYFLLKNNSPLKLFLKTAVLYSSPVIFLITVSFFSWGKPFVDVVVADKMGRLKNLAFITTAPSGTPQVDHTQLPKTPKIKEPVSKEPANNLVNQQLGINKQAGQKLAFRAEIPIYFHIYYGNLIGFLGYLEHSSVSAIFGEGPKSQVYHRGSDVGLFEFVATAGIPLATLFFVGCIFALFSAWKLLKRDELPQIEKISLIFAIPAIIFSLTSLIHYDVLFRKEIYFFFCLALALVRRVELRESGTCRVVNWEPLYHIL